MGDCRRSIAGDTLGPRPKMMLGSDAGGRTRHGRFGEGRHGRSLMREDLCRSPSSKKYKAKRVSDARARLSAVEHKANQSTRGQVQARWWGGVYGWILTAAELQEQTNG